MALSHICVETHQNRTPCHSRGGYRQDLLENILSPLEKSLIVCCSCEGVIRDPQMAGEGYMCTSCLDGEEGRPATVNKRAIEKLRVVCPFRQEGCVWSSTIGLLVSHVEGCDLSPVSCSLGCGHSLKRVDLKKHEMYECPERITNCEFCLIAIKVSQISHHEETCPMFPLKCSNGCVADRIPRMQMSAHISDVCPLTMIPCPYKQYGCSTSRKRKDLDTHETAFVVKHVRMMNTHIEEMDTCKKSVDTQVTKLTSRMEKVEEAIQPNKGLIWKINGIEEKFELEERVYSGSFYVNNYNFRVCAGFNTGDNYALGIFVSLRVGVLDDSLKWPFLGKVFITLVNTRN